MKFMFDENLSSDEIITHTVQVGYVATGIPQLNLAGIPDEDIIEMCIRNNFVVVTANTKHFRPKYQKFLHHPGLICLKSKGAKKTIQISFFQRVLDEMQKQGLNDLTDKIAVATLNRVDIN